MMMKGNAETHKIALDFGGTLLKVVVYDKKRNTSFTAAFPIRHSDVAFNFIKQHCFHEIYCTGGGALKYENLILGELAVPLRLMEEVSSLCAGVNFSLTKKLVYQLTTMTNPSAKPPSNRLYLNEDASMNIYPYLIANVGTGTSFILVKAAGQAEFQRIGGTAFGGGTFLGLGNLLAGNFNSNGFHQESEYTFEELCSQACTGNAKSVDLMVENIYGNEIPDSLHLSPDALASSFGKYTYLKPTKKLSPKDSLASLLEMLCYNTCHLAWLSGREFQVKNIVFTGSFVSGAASCNESIREKMHEWLSVVSRGECHAFFVENAEFVGALGCLYESIPSEEGKRAFLNAEIKRKSIYLP